jgi:hypothetical protein
MSVSENTWLSETKFTMSLSLIHVERLPNFVQVYVLLQLFFFFFFMFDAYENIVEYDASRHKITKFYRAIPAFSNFIEKKLFTAEHRIRDQPKKSLSEPVTAFPSS